MTIKGYVARDKNGDIWFHYYKPKRENDIEKTPEIKTSHQRFDTPKNHRQH